MLAKLRRVTQNLTLIDCEGGVLALNAAAARAASKKKNPVQETPERPESPVENTVDENHPLFKIISQRRKTTSNASHTGVHE